MTGLDFAVAGILLISMALGLWRGLIHEVMLLLGWPVAFVLAGLFEDDLLELLAPLNEPYYRVVSYVLIFAGVLLVWTILTELLSRVLKKAGIGWPDRVLGGFFGMLRGALLVLVLVWGIGMTDMFKHPLWREAVFSGTLESIALFTRSWLPDVLAERISYGIRS